MRTYLVVAMSALFSLLTIKVVARTVRDAIESVLAQDDIIEIVNVDLDPTTKMNGNGAHAYEDQYD